MSLGQLVVFAVAMLAGVIVWATLYTNRRLAEIHNTVEFAGYRLHAIYMKLDHPEKHYCVVVDENGYSVEEDV